MGDRVTFFRRYQAAFVVYAVFVPFVAAVVTLAADWSVRPPAISNDAASATATPAPAAVVTASRAVSGMGTSVPTPGRSEEGGSNGSALAANFGPPISGLVWALVFWLAAPLVNGFASAEGMHGGIHGELRSRASELRRRISSFKSEGEPVSPERPGDYREVAAAVELASDYCTSVDTLLQPNSGASQGLAWVRGWGYSDCWRQLHRAEEELLRAEPPPGLLGNAYHDLLRLSGSAIENKDRFIADLQRAAVAIDQQAAAYFSGTSAGAAADLMSTDLSEHDSAHAHRGERAILKEIRNAINVFREKEWDGIIRLRNSHFQLIALSGLITYAPLAVAIVARVDSVQLLAAALFYLVGAGVGLFNQLRTGDSGRTPVEDYGLSAVRTFGSIATSGLAAAFGIVLIEAMPAIIGATTGQSTTLQFPGWDQVYRLSPGAIVWAAVFGLAPDRVLTQLQQAETHLDNISSSEASSRSSSV